MSAGIAAYPEAYKDWKPSPSHTEVGWIFIITSDEQQPGFIKA